MVRHHLHVTTRLGKGGEYQKAFGDLQAAAQAASLPQSRLWGMLSGDIQHFVLVAEYVDLAAFDAGFTAAQANAEFMAAWRRSLELVDEHPWYEVWQTVD